MKCNELQEWIFPYAEGRLDEPSKALLEGHLAVCESCRDEVEATRLMLAALDEQMAPPDSVAIDVDASLQALRARLEPSAAPAMPEPSAWERLRWWLFGGLATAGAAAAVVAFVVTGIGPGPHSGSGKAPGTVAEKGTAEPEKGSSGATEAAGIVEMLEDLPLYENLDCFRDENALAAVLEEDEAVLEALLEEVQG